VIGVGSNSRTWAQIEIFKRPSSGRAVVEWNTVDIVRGYTVWRGHAANLVVPVANFPPLQAVRSGRNVLRLSVQELGQIQVARVKVSPVAVLSTSLVPDPLKITASVHALGLVHAGDVISVPYTLRNRNPTPLHGVRIVVTNARGLEARPDVTHLESLTGSRRGVIRIHVKRAGTLGFDLAAKTDTASDGVRVNIDSRAALAAPSGRNRLVWGLGTGVAVFLVCNVLWLGLRRIRRGR